MFFHFSYVENVV